MTSAMRIVSVASLAVLLSVSSVAGQATRPAARRAAAASSGGQTAKDWKQLRYPALADIKIPDIKRYVLSNGLRLFVVEDHRLPVVDGFAVIRTGSRWEPAGKAGLASITGQVMRTGGTAAHPGDALDRQLEGMAASVESSIGQNSGSASFSALKGDFDRVLGIFADVLMAPAFPEDKIELAKTFARSDIARRNDDAQDIAGREYRKLLYGADSPYARQAEYTTVEAITRQDLVDFYRRYYCPNNAIIGISGDVNAEEVRRKVERAFASWKPARNLQLPPVPAVTAGRRASLNFVRKEDVNQTSIYIGQLGGQLNDQDYYALAVMSQVLAAGSFSSRITKHVRSELGLAYEAGGDWDAAFDHPGTFSVFVGTKSESVSQAIDAVMKEIRQIREKPITEEELRIAKESMLNSFVFDFARPSQVLSRVITYNYYDYPEDFLQRYRANVGKVTRQDVLRVARQHLDPDRLTVMVVGNDKQFDRPLAQLGLAGGRVNQLEVTIPPDEQTAASARRD